MSILIQCGLYDLLSPPWQINTELWRSVFQTPYTPRQSWSFLCVLEECGDTPHSLALLHPCRVSRFHSSDSTLWGLDFSPPTSLVLCWQTQRPQLWQPQLVHVFFNLWLLWRSFTNNLHRKSVLALLPNLEVLCVASCSAIFRPVFFLFFLPLTPSSMVCILLLFFTSILFCFVLF